MVRPVIVYYRDKYKNYGLNFFTKTTEKIILYIRFRPFTHIVFRIKMEEYGHDKNNRH